MTVIRLTTDCKLPSAIANCGTEMLKRNLYITSKAAEETLIRGLYQYGQH